MCFGTLAETTEARAQLQVVEADQHLFKVGESVLLEPAHSQQPPLEVTSDTRHPQFDDAAKGTQLAVHK